MFGGSLHVEDVDTHRVPRRKVASEGLRIGALTTTSKAVLSKLRSTSGCTATAQTCPAASAQRRGTGADMATEHRHALVHRRGRDHSFSHALSRCHRRVEARSMSIATGTTSRSYSWS